MVAKMGKIINIIFPILDEWIRCDLPNTVYQVSMLPGLRTIQGIYLFTNSFMSLWLKLLVCFCCLYWSEKAMGDIFDGLSVEWIVVDVSNLDLGYDCSSNYFKSMPVLLSYDWSSFISSCGWLPFYLARIRNYYRAKVYKPSHFDRRLMR